LDLAKRLVARWQVPVEGDSLGFVDNSVEDYT
jgi:hypothetical protein